MPLSRLGDYLSQSSWNANLTKIEAAGANNIGRGILTGCALSAGTGLVLNVAGGVVHASGAALIVNSTTYTLPASGTFYVWIEGDSGVISHSVSGTDPGNPMVCLGQVTTGASTISSVSETGRVMLLRFESGAYKIGNGGIVLNPNGELTTSGAAEIGGQLVAAAGAVMHGVTEIHHAKPVPNTQTLTENLTLTGTSKSIQALTASGANRTVFLPATTAYGDKFLIMNVGSSNNIIIRDSDDTTTIATLTPGQSFESIVLPQSGGGGAKWASVADLATGSVEE
jgi:hypothetical protein